MGMSRVIHHQSVFRSSVGEFRIMHTPNAFQISHEGYELPGTYMTREEAKIKWFPQWVGLTETIHSSSTLQSRIRVAPSIVS
jgi:hypothetical protein